jgi:hypothetical protein
MALDGTGPQGEGGGHDRHSECNEAERKKHGFLGNGTETSQPSQKPEKGL